MKKAKDGTLRPSRRELLAVASGHDTAAADLYSLVLVMRAVELGQTDLAGLKDLSSEHVYQALKDWLDTVSRDDEQAGPIGAVLKPTLLDFLRAIVASLGLVHHAQYRTRLAQALAVKAGRPSRPNVKGTATPPANSKAGADGRSHGGAPRVTGEALEAYVGKCRTHGRRESEGTLLQEFAVSILSEEGKHAAGERPQKMAENYARTLRRYRARTRPDNVSRK
jgi:hypothetical protein